MNRYVVPQTELVVRASRAGGPGGQHVNKVSTRVEVVWDVAHSPGLDEAQRARLLERLRRRMDAAGTLRVVATERRSQLRNRQAALKRLQALVDAALYEPPARKRTRPSRAAIEGRLAGKRRRGLTKHRRRPVDDQD